MKTRGGLFVYVTRDRGPTMTTHLLLVCMTHRTWEIGWLLIDERTIDVADGPKAYLAHVVDMLWTEARRQSNACDCVRIRPS